jgi:hypothetical protein
MKTFFFFEKESMKLMKGQDSFPFDQENLLGPTFIFTWSISFLGILVDCIIGETKAKFRASFTIP